MYLEPTNHAISNHNHDNTSKRRRTLENPRQSVHHDIIGVETWEPSEHEPATSSLSPSQGFGPSYERNDQLLEAIALNYLDPDINLVTDDITTSFIPHGEQSDRSGLTNERQLQWAIRQHAVDNYSDWGVGAMNDMDHHRYLAGSVTEG